MYVPAQDSASPFPGKEGSFSAAPNTRGSINYYPEPRFCLTEGVLMLHLPTILGLDEILQYKRLVIKYNPRYFHLRNVDLRPGSAALYGRLSDESWFQAEHQTYSPAWPLPVMLTS